MFDMLSVMATWPVFAAARPLLAADIRALIHQYGPGLAYLATVRADGGPRVHPVAPFVADDGLYCFVVRSPKRRDLLHDGRYALHSYPSDTADDEAYLSGHALPVPDGPRLRRCVAEMRAAPAVDWRLFELTVDVAMLVRHGGGAGRSRVPEIWHDRHAECEMRDERCVS